MDERVVDTIRAADNTEAARAVVVGEVREVLLLGLSIVNHQLRAPRTPIQNAALGVYKARAERLLWGSKDDV